MVIENAGAYLHRDQCPSFLTSISLRRDGIDTPDSEKSSPIKKCNKQFMYAFTLCFTWDTP